MMFKIHNKNVLAFVQTEIQSTGPCGIVLVEVEPGIEWVTAWYRLGDKDWSNGNYHFDKQEAYNDLIERVKWLMPKITAMV